LSDAIPTSSQQPWATSEPQRFDLGNTDVNSNDVDDGDDVNREDAKEASHADDGLTQNLED
jgi:hypothetical protein